jgi:hypothetical protein
MLELLEPIDVWVLFNKSGVQPSVFFWKGRQIKIDTINLVHTSKEEGRTFYHFSISSAGNFYRLGFDISKLKWILEAVDEDDPTH